MIGHHHLTRLERARYLLRQKGYDTEATKLTLYGGAGFTSDLKAAAAGNADILLVDLDQLYAS
ncbi:hypothetical protein [Actinoplanes derwentensis]|uniref:hypothetical protein n=1 Tax=Actinoplanes derwentensis TaxID=113562 RepID=UPI0018D49C3A|nr:hypothetical protein [Actinoplanes derwentensis]